MNILIAACPQLEEGFSLYENVPTGRRAAGRRVYLRSGDRDGRWTIRVGVGSSNAEHLVDDLSKSMGGRSLETRSYAAEQG